MNEPIPVTSAEFKAQVLECPGVVLVDFFAEWCGPCKMLAPLVAELAADYAGRVKVCKVDTDESGDVAAEYGIMGVPTLMFFKNGERVDQVVGYVPKGTLVKKLDACLSSVP